MSTNFIILAIDNGKLLVIGLEPILFIKNQILSLTCLPISPNELLNIPQFDILTLGSQVFGLLVTLSFFYYFNINVVIPNFIEAKKFRTKKLLKNVNSVSSMRLDLTNNRKLVNNSYKLFFSESTVIVDSLKNATQHPVGCCAYTLSN